LNGKPIAGERRMAHAILSWLVFGTLAMLMILMCAIGQPERSQG
jgi:hypothetical protein